MYLPMERKDIENALVAINLLEELKVVENRVGKQALSGRHSASK
jgi:hypothetical protein|tara:strand:- start:2104 stop:2235 length:132 start_codon:yes stop_codon:yes gene_type:complete